jgi:hypothetical protein
MMIGIDCQIKAGLQYRKRRFCCQIKDLQYPKIHFYDCKLFRKMQIVRRRCNANVHLSYLNYRSREDNKDYRRAIELGS